MKEKIKSYIEKHKMLEENEKIVLGVSGGKDSICLFHILLNLGYNIEVVHINHCIRGEEAIRDQLFVEELCRKNNVNFHLRTYDIPKLSKETRMSEELVGRNCRREAFEEVLLKTNATKIALAHHKNDRAETMIFNMCRGAGINGLSSIKSINGKYIRPLLAVTRDEINDYIKINNIDYVEDSTNNECKYTRNHVRHNIIKEMNYINEKSVDNINRTIDNLTEISDFINLETEKAYRLYVKKYKNGLLIDKNLIKNTHPMLQKTVLRKCIEDIHGNLVNITEKHILTVIDLFNHGNGKYICLPKGIIAEKVNKSVLIYQK